MRGRAVAEVVRSATPTTTASPSTAPGPRIVRGSASADDVSSAPERAREEPVAQRGAAGLLEVGDDLVVEERPDLDEVAVGVDDRVADLRADTRRVGVRGCHRSPPVRPAPYDDGAGRVARAVGSGAMPSEPTPGRSGPKPPFDLDGLNRVIDKDAEPPAIRTTSGGRRGAATIAPIRRRSCSARRARRPRERSSRSRPGPRSPTPSGTRSSAPTPLVVSAPASSCGPSSRSSTPRSGSPRSST